MSIQSDVTVILRNAAGEVVAPEEAGPGSYTVIAFFQDQVPTTVQEIAIQDGSSISIRCNKRQQRCVIR